MNIDELQHLVNIAADESANLEKAAIGFCGYGFVFKDVRYSNDPYVFTSDSRKLAAIGAYRDLIKKWDKNHDQIRHIDELMRYDERYDCFFAASLKTLIPTLEFGGDEVLFDVWMFVKTPEGKQFPATFYFGPSGTSLGGWDSYKDSDDKNIFPPDFMSIINCSPFDFSKDKMKGLVEALECAFRRVPISDFYGIYQHDLGNALMGVKIGIPFIIELGYTFDNNDIEFYLGLVSHYKDRFSDYC